MSEPREWTLDNIKNDGNKELLLKNGPDLVSGEVVHVIEYAAYEALEKELKEARATIEIERNLFKNSQHALEAERARAARLIDALKILADIKNYDGDSAFSYSIPVKPGLGRYVNGYTFAQEVVDAYEREGK